MGVFIDTTEDFTIKMGDRIAYAIPERIETPQVKKVATLDDTNHGARGFGSSRIQSLSQSTRTNNKNGKIKNNTLPSKLGIGQWQAQGSVNMVLSMGPGPSNQN